MDSTSRQDLAFGFHARGAAYFRMRHYLEAEQDLREALQLVEEGDPNGLFYMISLANACQMNWKYIEAEMIYNKVLDSEAPESLGRVCKLCSRANSTRHDHL